MPDPRRALGEAAEDEVERRLRAAGWRLLDRNARTRFGELDLVALDGETLVFVEVKASRPGRRRGPERPVLAVGPRKQRRIRTLASAWLAAARGLAGFREVRFDAVGVVIGRDGRVLDYEHVERAF